MTKRPTEENVSRRVKFCLSAVAEADAMIPSGFGAWKPAPIAILPTSARPVIPGLRRTRVAWRPASAP